MWAGTAAIVLGIGKVHASTLGEYDFSGSPRFGWTVGFLLVLCLASYAVGLPDRPPGMAAAGSALAVALSGALATSLVQLAVGAPILPRFVILGSALLLIPWALVACRLTASSVARQAGRDRVVAIVGPTEAAALVADVARARSRPLRVMQTITPEDAAAGSVLALRDAVVGDACSVLVLDRSAQVSESVVAQAAELHMQGVRVRTLAMFYDEWLGKLPLSELEQIALLFDIGELHEASYARVKRIVDVLLAILGTVTLVAVVPLIILLNLVCNRGPLFYRQPRVGKGGEVFTIFKFRTMRPGCSGSEWTTVNDPRVTPFGRLLRHTHLDELPQVLNVLRGDLSIVGPRPEQPQYVDELREKIPFYDVRHLVRPGLTGWAQVNYDYASSDQDALEKLQFEFYYLRHQGLPLDLRIIGRTLRSVAGRSGR